MLNIIAGTEQKFEGEVHFTKDYSIGMLSQEPELDNTKTVKEIVQEGVQEVVDVLKEYEEVNNKFSEPMDDDEMTKLIERQGELTEQIEHMNGWEIDAKLERAMDALRTPDGDALVKIFPEVKEEESLFADFC